MLTQEQRLERSSRAAVELPQTEQAFAELRAAIIEKWAVDPDRPRHHPREAIPGRAELGQSSGRR
jgi:hypothetical protein